MKGKEKKLKVKSACEAEEAQIKQERWNKVAYILKDVEHYRTKEAFEEAVNSLTKANLSLEEIEQIAVRLRPDYLSKAKEYHRS